MKRRPNQDREGSKVQAERGKSEPAMLSEYVPASWFHPKGVHKVVRKLEKRLPNVSGCLFLTFTFDPSLFQDAESAFEMGRDRLRRIFHALRKGIEWEGQSKRIDAPYFVKVEFHANGWAHFHVLFRTKRFLPGALLNHLWKLGRTNVKRISNSKFRYLLKYVTKSGDIPEWVLNRERIRIVQASRGFYEEPQKADPIESDDGQGTGSKRRRRRPRRREIRTIRERLERWAKSALFRDRFGDYSAVPLRAEFHKVFNDLVFEVAMDGRYLGNGKIEITINEDLYPWLMYPNSKADITSAVL